MAYHRVLYHPNYGQAYREALAQARADLREMHAAHLDELAALRDEVAELRAIFLDLVRAEREQAEGTLASLRAQLEVAVARLERDPQRPLH